MLCIAVQSMIRELGEALELRDLQAAEQIFWFNHQEIDWEHDYHEECRRVIVDARRSLQALLEEFGEQRPWFVIPEEKFLWNLPEDDATRLFIFRWKLRTGRHPSS